MSEIASLSVNHGDELKENYHDLVPNTEVPQKNISLERNAGVASSTHNALTHPQSKRIRLNSGSQTSITHDSDDAGGSVNMFVEGPQEIIDVFTQLNVEKIEPKIRAIIFKYVGSEQVVRCLEFAGFISPHVLSHLDEVGVRRLEDFVGHTSSLLSSSYDRQMLLGPIFFRHPEQFRLPTGAVLGLFMAAKEIRQLIEKSRNMQECEFGRNIDVCSNKEVNITKNAVCQTDMSSVFMGNPWSHCITTKGFETPQLSSPVPSNEQATLIASPSPSSGCDYITSVTTTISSLAGGLKSTVSSSNTTDPIAVVNAAIQAAAVVAMPGDAFVNASDYSSFLPRLDRTLFSNNYSAVSPSTSQSQIINKGINGTATIACGNVDDVGSVSCQLRPTTILQTSAGTNEPSLQHPALENPPTQATSLTAGLPETNGSTGIQLSTNSTSDVTIISGSYTSDEISCACLERLKLHSSDRASRLAARQFVDAHLVRGRDFDMEMEVSLNAEGLKRVTGIFYCHLCRVTRERTCAVRFSIARSRYPVLSNVLSHLRTHFQYKSHVTFSDSKLGSQPVVSMQSLCVPGTNTANETPGTLNTSLINS